MFRLDTNIRAIIPLSGNIGSGKTTFLNKARACLQNLDPVNAAKIVFVEEPTEEWLTHKASCGKSFFEKMYNREPHAAFYFQILALSTRIQKIITSVKNNPLAEVFVIERGVDDDRYVFAEKLATDGLISPDELALIDGLKTTWREFIDPYIFGGIYLKVSPNTSQKRLHKRLSDNIRPEEAAIQFEYLSSIYSNYEKLVAGEFTRYSYTHIDGEADLGSREYEEELERCSNFLLSFTL